MMMGLLEIKQALQTDQRFRARFPEFGAEIEAFLKDPSCACNAPLYRKIAARLESPLTERSTPEQTFEVINCKASELNDRLKKIKRVAAAVSLARWEEEVTVVLRYLT